jgi:hypothetical protein
VNFGATVEAAKANKSAHWSKCSGGFQYPALSLGREVAYRKLAFEFAQISGTHFCCARGGVDDRAAPP